LGLKANTADMTTSLGLKATTSDLTSGLALKVDKVTGKELSTNDYTTTEKNKLAAITGSNTGDQDISSFATNTNLDLKANISDVNTSLALKANLISPNLTAPILGDATATSLSVNSGISASTLTVTNLSATTINATNVTVTNDVKAKRYLLTYNAAATSTIDLSTGNIFQILLTGATAFILPTPNASTVGTYIVRFKQDNIGGRVVTFSNTASTTTKLYWAGGVVPIITSGANKIDFMTIICDGISYYATMIQNFY
jgi:hypothetical protein